MEVQVEVNLVEGADEGLVALEDLLDELPVLGVHRQHVLHEVGVHGLALHVCDALHARLPDVPLHLLQQHRLRPRDRLQQPGEVEVQVQVQVQVQVEVDVNL